MPRLLIATRNAHKTAEIAAMLGTDLEVVDLRSLSGAPEIAENGATFAENAAIKALTVSRHVRGWTLADDSGLEVDALAGEPGVRSARYAGEQATDMENNQLLLTRLAALSGAPRTARFRCALALAHNDSVVATFEGVIEGRVIEALKGPGGFGYDPMFIPEGYDATFGELPPLIKNAISHRSRALAKFRIWLETHPLS